MRKVLSDLYYRQENPSQGDYITWFRSEISEFLNLDLYVGPKSINFPLKILSCYFCVIITQKRWYTINNPSSIIILPRNSTISLCPNPCNQKKQFCGCLGRGRSAVVVVDLKLAIIWYLSYTQLCTEPNGTHKTLEDKPSSLVN